ncbi:MAG: tRNA (N6-threonylcarbamoyladenosine(37)-N6)-methyltransferase TrmO [Dehalococcoidales bacterium]|nr:tRNA (N6-threonylcarbamoyladenosine(37)-N6)-methyltransferase TrmO [Dehalococcoidales bacterium]
MNEIIYKPIGIIHTPYTDKNSTPIQGCFAPDSTGYIELFPEYAPGLQNIEEFSHLFLIYHFHQAGCAQLIAKPFLDKEKKGIFAIRYFTRPNPIGLSVVKLLRVNGNILDIGEVDMLDGTPLLDIKPYVSKFDIRDCVTQGWYSRATERAKYENQ